MKHVGRWISIWLVAAGISFSGGCSKEMPGSVIEARKANVTPPQFVGPERHGESHRATLLLFVHGIFGDTLGTWCHSNGACLPDLVLGTPEFSGRLDAFAFGYASAMVQQGSFSIPEAAKALHSEIEFRQLLDRYDRIVVIAHSMGGLVAMEMLTTFPDVAKRVPLVVTFGTPYNGSQVAELGGTLLANPALADMVPLDTDNSLLTSLANRWKTQRRMHEHPTEVVCAYEKIPVFPLFDRLIVPQSSAVALCDDAADPIADDHLGIVKPNGHDHGAYKVLVNALRRLAKRTDSASHIDVDMLTSLAQIPDRELRLQLYRQITKADVSPEVRSLIVGLSLSEDVSPIRNTSSEEIETVSTPEELRALLGNSSDVLPCRGELKFEVVEDFLRCTNGEPIAIGGESKSAAELGTIDLVVFHGTGTYSLDQTLRVLASPRIPASVHIVIGRRGGLVQLTPFDRQAWHAGRSKWSGRERVNAFSVGIEMVNLGRLEPDGETFQAGRGGRAIASQDVDRVGDQAWQKHTPEQIAVATAVTDAIAREYGVRKIAGHCHVSDPPGRKSDPGPNFPFAEVEAAVFGSVSGLGPCGEI